jgi:hypothetical protein
LARTFRAAASVDNGLAADQPRTQLGDRVGFGVALLLGAGLAVFVRDGDVEGRDTQTSNSGRTNSVRNSTSNSTSSPAT